MYKYGESQKAGEFNGKAEFFIFRRKTAFRNRRFTKFDFRVVAINRKTGYNIHTAAEIRPSIFQTEITDMILADKIQSLRKKSGMAQEEPAAKVGVSRQAVSKWESRRAVPELKSKNL